MSWRQKLRAAFAALVEAPEIVRAEEPVVTLKEVDSATPPAKVGGSRRAAPYRPDDGTIAGSELSTKLENLSHRALDRLDDVLDVQLDPDDDWYPDHLRALNAAAKTVLHTQVRVDEHRLKARRLDVLPELLAAIADEEKKKLIEA